MADYKITCCSTADITVERLAELGCAFGKYHYIIDGKDYLDSLYASETPAEFYGKIDAGAMPTTAQVSPEELCALFEPILSAGYDLLHIEFSSGLSGGWQSALQAQKIMAEKYPERKVYVVDSLAASSGYGLLVAKAVELKNGGMPIDELKTWIEDNRLNLRHWFYATNLMHFKRGGRVSGPSAVIGTALKICPVMDVNDEGKLIVREKALGRKKALRSIFNHMCQQAQGGMDYSGKCYICHSMMDEDALALKAMIEEAFPHLDGEVEIYPIGTVIGSHTGPGTVAVFFFSKDKRTR
ncbi:MAG: DegV family protein [Clostridia bacterium]|nr:DegV family protein [Clostridia bacterium]